MYTEKMNKTKPLLRGHFHQAMFFVALGACLPLLIRCHTLIEKVAVGIYSLCALSMFGISTIYHRINWSPEKRLLWKKLDHCGIYLMIAGTFTPLALLALSDSSRFKLLLTIWTVTFIGILQSLFFVNLPKYISAGIYLIAGYLILPYLKEIGSELGLQSVWLIVGGGVVYSLGAFCYAFKRPVLNPQVFSYHEIFHLFVNAGAALHFCLVNSLIR